jgi:hypothetical protein
MEIIERNVIANCDIAKRTEKSVIQVGEQREKETRCRLQGIM